MNANISVIIGRWQILQRGHLSLLHTALATAPHVVIVIGSAWRARDAHNPFTWQERQQMWEAALTAEQRARVSFLPVRDYYDNDRWNEAVRAGVAKIAKRSDKIALVGYKKDHSSAYLEQFPGWELIEVTPTTDISATDLRCMYFEATNRPAALTVIGNYVTEGVRGYLEAWAHLPAYRQCAAEHKAVKAYRQKWTAPFYLTADAVVTANKHVLLVRRGGDIGHGLWALPGGFLEENEQFYAAAVRELKEETGLNPMPSLLRAALKGQAVFDHPGRSPRGRLVTQAFHFDLGTTHTPEVRAGSDAMEVGWILISELAQMEDQLFEDHGSIIDHFLGVFRWRASS